MRRLVPLVVAGLLLGACGDDDPGASPDEVTTTSAGASSATSSPSGSTATTGATAPPTTADLDGREPDRVEPPPADGVPTTAVPTSGTTRTPLPGFGEVVVEVQRIDGEVVSWCLLLAETPAQTQRGLMEVTDPDLGGYDGMLFRFTEDRTGGFYMRNTPQPLSLAYLDAAGEVVSIEQMAPCEDVEGCPTYAPGGAYRHTIEVPEAVGGVAALGIEAGAGVTDTGRTCAP